jgi:hypothetical protein
VRRLAIAALLALGACATVPKTHREFLITPLDGSAPARFPISPLSNNGMAATTLHGETYSGPWSVLTDGGVVGSATTMVQGEDGWPHAVRTNALARQTGATGRLLLRSEGGDTITCDFRFDFSSMTGIGRCAGARHGAYDLQVFNVRD